MRMQEAVEQRELLDVEVDCLNTGIEQVKEPASFDTISILKIKCSPLEKEPG